jgi:hypothetical protein
MIVSCCNWFSISYYESSGVAPISHRMGWLCRCVDYHGNVTAILAEYILDCRLIANVGIIVPVTRQIGLERCA